MENEITNPLHQDFDKKRVDFLWISYLCILVILCPEKDKLSTVHKYIHSVKFCEIMQTQTKSKFRIDK